MHLADAVNVVALTRERTVILVEQFRAGSGRNSLETPGGLLNPGEDPRDAGARELLEETGYAGDPPVVLGSVWSNPSIMSSKITTVLISNARKIAEPTLDEGEEVRVVGRYATIIPGMIARGEIDHALAVQGLLLWMVAEMPNSPVLPPGFMPAEPRRQFRIRNLMLVVAGFAVAFALIANLGPALSLVLAEFLALPASIWIVQRTLDETPVPILLRYARNSHRRRLLRTLAVVGLWGIATGFVALIANVFSVFSD
jgi:8-oxo-dGTP pyrophosphatase MutT (NUDIX family)